MFARSFLLSSALAIIGSAALAENPVRIDDARGGGLPASIGIKEQSGGGEVRLQLAPRVDTSATTDLSLQRWQDFKGEVLLSVRTDPALVPSARVLEMVASIQMVDDFGAVIASGFDINVEHDVVLAVSGGKAEITHITNDERGLVITALVRDEAGNVIDPPQGALALYRTGGERLCFEEQIVQVKSASSVPLTASTAAVPGERLPMNFVILLDRSGSMKSVMEDVKSAARSFVHDLPDNATCAVGAFADKGGSFEPSEGLGIGQCIASNFPMDGVVAGGGTDLFQPLKVTYEWLAEEKAGQQSAVIIITDGALNKQTDLLHVVRDLKGSALTFVYFLGGREERYLRSLADSYLTHEGDLADQLPRYFQVLSETYSSQTVLRQVACSAEGTQP
ncbi:VWA domain-containing protein [Salipiger abyssi]|uniref:VWA domain-containing protein n=1 Tax=Salipiger abyssi TaxID=1250539 RepID=UPI001A8DAB54|nr:VWA domain-containing protein [Salipiger abyssi]MBN9889381.1 VWA domain-containing protein [Salipiger abyssi]